MTVDQNTYRWFAAYTRSHHEKSAAEVFGQRLIEHFLPTYSSVRVWKDRKIRLELPIFPGYVFVRLALAEKRKVLLVPGIVRLIGFGDQPLPVADSDIETLRVALETKLRIEPHPFLVAGRQVRITRGPLEGMQGILVRRKGKLRLLLSIELIQRSAMIEVDTNDVEPLFGTRLGRPSVRCAPQLAELPQ